MPMKTFLQSVAESLLNRFGNNLSQLVVVFPGKRAGLFLDQALAAATDAPLWSPSYTTISDKVMKVAEKLFVGTDILHIAVFQRGDERTV